MMDPRVVMLVLLAILASGSSQLLRSEAQSRSLAGNETEDLDIAEVVEVEEDPHEIREKTNTRGNELTPRIVGGYRVARGKYGYFVRVDKNRWPACGGSLVAPDIVLTAAHCQMPSPKELSVVVNGYHDKTPVNGDQRFRNVEQIHIHPEYVKAGGVYRNDVMLLKLDKPVYDIPLVELNREASRPWINEEVTVMGLGALKESGGYPDTLQAVKVGVIDFDECSDSYASARLGPLLPDIMVCAGQRQGKRDSCQGDSGGPLINRQGIQVGVVSFGLGCGREGYPGVYVRTAVDGSTDDWLGKTLCKLTDTNRLNQWCKKPLKRGAIIAITPPTPKPTIKPTFKPTQKPSPQPRTPLPTREPRTVLRTPLPMRTPRTLPPTPSRKKPLSLNSANNADSKKTVAVASGGKCQDAPDQRKFRVGAFKGKKTCSWVRNSHKVVQEWSCVPGDIVWKLCKETCGRC